MKKQWISFAILFSLFAVGCKPAATSSIPSSVASSASVSDSEASSSKENVSATGITLDKTAVTLRPGETTDLKATVTPADTTDPTVTWTSSDVSIATVDTMGKVTAIALGKATITAKTGTLSATCEVTVVHSYPTAVNLDFTDVSLKIDETKKLTATVAPATASQEVLFTSDDGKVATVDATGLITAVHSGTAHILVTARTKGENDQDVSATCTVVIHYDSITSFTATSDRNTLYVGESAVITPVIAPATADPEVSYHSSAPGILTVDGQGKVTAVAVGEAQIDVYPVSDPSREVFIFFTVLEYVASLSVDSESLTMGQNDTHQIVATVTPSTTVTKCTYVSEDPTVATVSSTGLITAVKAGGQTTVTVSTVGLSSTSVPLSKSIAVRVYDYPTSVSIRSDGGVSSILVGGSLNIYTSVSPSTANQNIFISSSNPLIASLVTADSHTFYLTGVALGKVTLVADTGYTDSNNKEIKATLDVSVDLGVTSVTAEASEELTMGQTVQIVTHVYVGEGVLAANQSVTFESYGNGITCSDTGLVTAVESGQTGTVFVHPVQAASSNLLPTEIHFFVS
jgi:uncharacterized protein YjdB